MAVQAIVARAPIASTMGRRRGTQLPCRASSEPPSRRTPGRARLRAPTSTTSTSPKTNSGPMAMPQSNQPNGSSHGCSATGPIAQARGVDRSGDHEDRRQGQAEAAPRSHPRPSVAPLPFAATEMPYQASATPRSSSNHTDRCRHDDGHGRHDDCPVEDQPAHEPRVPSGPGRPRASSRCDRAALVRLCSPSLGDRAVEVAKGASSSTATMNVMLFRAARGEGLPRHRNTPTAGRSCTRSTARVAAARTPAAGRRWHAGDHGVERRIVELAAGRASTPNRMAIQSGSTATAATSKAARTRYDPRGHGGGPASRRAFRRRRRARHRRGARP